MNKTEMLNKIQNAINLNEDNYMYIGIRFENKVRNIGEIINDLSKANPDREDVRDFPAYGSEEYDELEELKGVCAYDVERRTGWHPNDVFAHEFDDIRRGYLAKHCYLLGCEDIEYGEDENEIIMIDAVVLEIVF